LELPLTNPQPISSLPQYKQKQKMAVFDLDKTLFDLSRRERVAKRAGHNLGTPAAWAEMNKPQHISKDEPIEGTVELGQLVDKLNRSFKGRAHRRNG
jgi:FMN phosphatase YigB (HAD superfamily)